MTAVNQARRRLAIVYHPRSFGVYAVARAAAGVCSLVWIVDTRMPGVDVMSRLMGRLGGVVDVAGMSLDDAAASVAAARPDGILTFEDGRLPWSAAVAERLGLPFHTPETAARCADKYLERAALRSAGLPGPSFWSIPERTDDPAWRTLVAEARFPALLKLRHGAGSRELHSVTSLEALRASVGDIRRRYASDPPELMVEEYLPDRPGDLDSDFAGYVSVESIVSAGRISHAAITGRFQLAEPFRERGFFVPAALASDDQDAVLATATGAIAAMGITLGGVHTEIKLTPGGPRVIEVNGRVGGGVPTLLAEASGVELLPAAMRVALGEPVVFERLVPCAKVVYELYGHAPVSMRRVSAIEGVEMLRTDPHVMRVTVNRRPGQSVDWREGNWGHVWSVRGAVDDHEQLAELARRIYSETRIHGH